MFAPLRRKPNQRGSLCGMASVWARISRGNKRTKGGKKITGASQAKLPPGQPHRSVKISCDSSVAFSANTK